MRKTRLIPALLLVAVAIGSAQTKNPVSSALRDGHEVISVVLHTDKPGIWEDSKALLTYGLIKVGCSAASFVNSPDRASEKDDPPGEGDGAH